MSLLKQVESNEEKVKEIFVEKLDVNEGDTFTFDKVLFVGGDSVKVGAPTVEGATVTATVNKQGRGKKITVFTYKRRKNSKRKKGHRQPYTKLTIDKINAIIIMITVDITVNDEGKKQQTLLWMAMLTMVNMVHDIVCAGASAVLFGSVNAIIGSTSRDQISIMTTMVVIFI